MNWSNIIKKIRKKLFITQEEFASMLGVCFASINRWENGHCEPTMKAKRKIAKICEEHNIEME